MPKFRTYSYIMDNPYAIEIKSDLKEQIKEQIAACRWALSNLRALGGEEAYNRLETLYSMLEAYLITESQIKTKDMETGEETTERKIKKTYKLKPIAELDQTYHKEIKKALRNGVFDSPRFHNYLREKFKMMMRLAVSKKVFRIKKPATEIY